MVSVSVTDHMLPIFFVLCSILWCCSARDTITSDDFLHDDGKGTLVSAGQNFELGFFSPTGKLNNGKYIGIWYYGLKERTVVWVANRANPLPDATGGALVIAEDGNLKLVNGKGEAYWSTKDLGSSFSMGKVGKLMDSGNFVLSDNRSGEILWESFKNPTDTFLPGMIMDESLTLTSWVSPVDPALGNYTFKQDHDEGHYIIHKDSITKYWRSTGSEGIHPKVTKLLSNSSDTNNFTSVPSPYTRLVMNFTGEIRYVSWETYTNQWNVLWSEPKDRCSVWNACGDFGSCNVNNLFMCKCLPGFKPKSPERWSDGYFSDGCSKKTTLCGDTFLMLKKIKLRRYDSELPGKDESDCRRECLKNCRCKAYAGAGKMKRDRDSIPPKCLIWSENLGSLQEDSTKGYNLSLRVAESDIESTVRNCETCGTDLISYPLSTGPNCGDPTYFSLRCDNVTDQVWFDVANDSYRVTIIAPESSRFRIQVNDIDNCEARNAQDRKTLQLNPPFRIASWCDAVTGDNSSSMSMKGQYEIEISWDPPPEPVCSSARDCKDWPNSSCRSQNGMRRCFCNQNFKWNNSILNCTQGGNPTKFATRSNQKSSSPVVVIGITIVVVLVVVLCHIGYIAYLRKKAITKRKEKRANQRRRLYHSESHVKHLIDSQQFKEKDKEDIDIPFFNLEDILAATDNFSNANKLGRGGFGPVYKGKFPDGQEIAVKRLSTASGQGLHEFKNEVVLIAQLQHRNLVRLLGYCVEDDEKILLYEYLPNKSLDSFIFDRTLCKLLNWEKRFDIILGIARGLVYLHHDSRLKIIHRDLKTSNILLDDEMNPKISDFGLAKILDSKHVAAKTERVVGTYGYMSPEYALDGFFSEKSDVFSFGVMVLEIVSGKRNTGFYQSDQILTLLGLAWKQWKEDKVLELMDQTLIETCNTNEFMRCVNVGLSCVQEDPSDRPTMAVALVMLSSSDTVRMPLPKQPAFGLKIDFSSTASSSSKHEASSNIEMLASIEEGR